MQPSGRPLGVPPNPALAAVPGAATRSRPRAHHLLSQVSPLRAQAAPARLHLPVNRRSGQARGDRPPLSVAHTHGREGADSQAPRSNACRICSISVQERKKEKRDAVSRWDTWQIPETTFRPPGSPLASASSQCQAPNTTRVVQCRKPSHAVGPKSPHTPRPEELLVFRNLLGFRELRQLTQGNYKNPKASSGNLLLLQ